MPESRRQAGVSSIPSTTNAKWEWVYSDRLQSTALIWQIRIAAGTAESTGSYSPKTAGLATDPNQPPMIRNLIIFEALVPNPSPPRSPVEPTAEKPLC